MLTLLTLPLQTEKKSSDENFADTRVDHYLWFLAYVVYLTVTGRPLGSVVVLAELLITEPPTHNLQKIKKLQ